MLTSTKTLSSAELCLSSNLESKIEFRLKRSCVSRQSPIRDNQTLFIKQALFFEKKKKETHFFQCK